MRQTLKPQNIRNFLIRDIKKAQEISTLNVISLKEEEKGQKVLNIYTIKELPNGKKALSFVCYKEN